MHGLVYVVKFYQCYGHFPNIRGILAIQRALKKYPSSEPKIVRLVHR